MGFHLIEGRMFAVGRNDRYRSLFNDLNGMITAKTLGELNSHSGCFYSRDWERGALAVYQQSFVEKLTKMFCVDSVQDVQSVNMFNGEWRE